MPRGVAGKRGGVDWERVETAGDSLGDEEQQFHGLHGHLVVLVQGHGDHPVLENKHERSSANRSASTCTCPIVDGDIESALLNAKKDVF